MSRTLSTIAVLLLAVPAFAQSSASPAVIWHDRGDPSTLDLSSGPGGSDREPGTRLVFIKESSGGASPKFDVQDERGVIWKVKLGEEAKPETAAARLLWAAGYIVKVTATHVDLRMDSRPFFLTIFNYRNYQFRTRMERVTKNIPIADARWIGDLLGRLSTTQIGDAFRSAGFSPSEVEAYTVVVARRVAALRALGGPEVARGP